MGISNLSSGLSLDRLEPATPVRTVETYSPNKDGERDSPGNDSAGGDSSPGEEAGKDSAIKGPGPDADEEQLRSFVPEPYIPAEPASSGNENPNPEPTHKIDRLA